MNSINVEPRLALIEILSDFRGKLLIAGRLNEKVPRPVFTGRGWGPLLRTGSLAEEFPPHIHLHYILQNIHFEYCLFRTSFRNHRS